ncbi:hypothetical protein GCM10011519_06870 [Marmoricola endophyticus]|uniref:Prepilin peptidase n=1 Tax=Marmoricola endophyticus TaxID=2040280 RepID=A0A917EZS0_9ACTN|nr:A24 family peptidase [Marmoricola endophyticus]GGF35961.1 hypothetical protein GCM10011519_06870 [Marmoricola endophyticus]
MTQDVALDWPSAAWPVGLAAGALLGLLVPWLVARILEPAHAEPDKRRYVDLAAARGLRLGSVVTGAVALGAMAGGTGWRWVLVPVALWVPLGVALAVVDWATLRLPTYYLAPAYPVTAVLLAAVAGLERDLDTVVRALAGWVLVGGFYLVLNLLGPRLVGYGDVRLAGLLGPLLGAVGWSELVVGLVLPFLGFGLVGVGLVVVHRDLGQLRRRLPFGPAMLGGAVVAVAAGPLIASWYLVGTP